MKLSFLGKNAGEKGMGAEDVSIANLGHDIMMKFWNENYVLLCDKLC